MGDGIWVTAVGYAGGATPNPTYEEVCSGRTGHNEVVLVVFDPKKVSYETLLKTFWESHDPTQGMRQGNDVGTQYRSGIYVDARRSAQPAEASKAAYQKVLSANGYGPITTEIVDAPAFYFAEDYHQQYLAKVPHGYCGLGGTGLSCPVGVSAEARHVPRKPGRQSRRGECDGDIQGRMLLRRRSGRGLGRTRRHGVLPLPIMPFVVGRTCERLHALETRCRAHHSRRRACRHVPEDAREPAAILQEMRGPLDDQSSSAGIGRCVFGHAADAEIQAGPARQLCRDGSTDAGWAPRS